MGGMVNPSIEMIVALKPDLVIATDEGNREETFVQLRRLGIPTYLVHAHRVDQMLDMVTRVAALVERREAAAPVVATIRERIGAIRARVAPRAAACLYVLWRIRSRPGRTAHLTELIEWRAGGYRRRRADSYVASASRRRGRAAGVIVLPIILPAGRTQGAVDGKWQRRRECRPQGGSRLTPRPGMRTSR